MLEANRTLLLCFAKKVDPSSDMQIQQKTQKYGVVVSIYYSHFPHAATGLEICFQRSDVYHNATNI
jgi:hypothetical protein